MRNFLSTDLICTNCGTINVAWLKCHDRKLNKEMKLYCFNCKNDEMQVIIGDKDLYARKVGLPIEDVIFAKRK